MMSLNAATSENPCGSSRKRTAKGGRLSQDIAHRSGPPTHEEAAPDEAAQEGLPSLGLGQGRRRRGQKHLPPRSPAQGRAQSTTDVSKKSTDTGSGQKVGPFMLDCLSTFKHGHYWQRNLQLLLNYNCINVYAAGAQVTRFFTETYLPLCLSTSKHGHDWQCHLQLLIDHNEHVCNRDSGQAFCCLMLCLPAEKQTSNRWRCQQA